MRREIINNFENNGCFVCGQRNPIGFKLKFYIEDDKRVVSECTPSEEYCGFSKVFHGGLQSTLLDDLTIWTLIGLRKRLGATLTLKIDYLKPLYIGEAIFLKGEIVSEEDNIAYVRGELINKRGDVCTRAESKILLISKNHFKKFSGMKEIPKGWGALL